METLDFGICRLAVVSIRKEPTHQAEQVSQLLFGDHYEVTGQSRDNKWLNIRVNFDQYTGWIDARQHQPITDEYYRHINDAEFKITTDVTATLLYNKSPVTVLLGSVIPISSTELFRMEEQFAFNGEAKNVGQKREFDFVRNIAQKYLNAPYQWGGKNPFGIDCSGFTQMVFKIAGYRLFRDAWQQATQGKSIRNLKAGKPGDLVFFNNDAGSIGHTGILLSPDRIIHASGKVRVDAITEEGIYNIDSKTITHRLAHLRRILAD